MGVIGEYINRRHNIGYHYIATRSIFEIATAAERRTGYRRSCAGGNRSEYGLEMRGWGQKSWIWSRNKKLAFINII